MATVIEKLKIHMDDRGPVFEPIKKDALRIQHNAHVVICRPGAVRGNHFHLKGTETIAVMGAALVRLKENGTIQDVEVPAQNVYRFTFPPAVAHAIKNTGDHPNVLIAFNTIEHDRSRSDSVEEILIAQ